MNCEGCVYFSDMQKIKTSCLVWGSTLPHPCTTCKRFPKEDKPLDNFQSVEVKGEGTYDILGRAR